VTGSNSYPDTFTPMFDSLVKRRELSRTACHVYGEIARIERMRLATWPSQRALAEKLDISTRQLRRHLRALERIGLLTTDHRANPRGGTIRYHVAPLNGTSRNPRTSASAPPGHQRPPSSGEREQTSLRDAPRGLDHLRRVRRPA
jgi:DNA-binding transcriptional ArsR family regulator